MTKKNARPVSTKAKKVTWRKIPTQGLVIINGHYKNFPNHDFLQHILL